MKQSGAYEMKRLGSYTVLRNDIRTLTLPIPYRSGAVFVMFMRRMRLLFGAVSVMFMRRIRLLFGAVSVMFMRRVRLLFGAVSVIFMRRTRLLFGAITARTLIGAVSALFRRSLKAPYRRLQPEIWQQTGTVTVPFSFKLFSGRCSKLKKFLEIFHNINYLFHKHR